jgi:hypothetical protein
MQLLQSSPVRSMRSCPFYSSCSCKGVASSGRTERNVVWTTPGYWIKRPGKAFPAAGVDRYPLDLRPTWNDACALTQAVIGVPLQAMALVS